MTAGGLFHRKAPDTGREQIAIDRAAAGPPFFMRVSYEPGHSERQTLRRAWLRCDRQ